MTSEKAKTIYSTKENCFKALIGNIRNLRDYLSITNKIKAEAAMIRTIREQEAIPQN